MKQKQVYVLDLTRMNGDGEFFCPKCGTIISPDDDSDEAYSVLEAKVEKGILTELIVRCNRCASQIRLTGFSLLQNLQGGLMRAF